MLKEKISLNWKKFCSLKKIFFNANKSTSLDQRKIFWINKTFFNFKEIFSFTVDQRNVSLIQRNCFLSEEKIILTNVWYIFYFTKCLTGNLKNTTENNK